MVGAQRHRSNAPSNSTPEPDNFSAGDQAAPNAAPLACMVLQDCWVIIFNSIYNITPLVAGAPPELIDPILANAGEDISRWFIRSATDGLPDVRSFCRTAPSGARIQRCREKFTRRVTARRCGCAPSRCAFSGRPSISRARPHFRASSGSERRPGAPPPRSDRNANDPRRELLALVAV